MKLRIDKRAFLDGLQVVQNVVSTRSTLPILSNVLVRAEDQNVFLTTTDLEVTVTCGVEASIDIEGSSTLPVRRLASIVRELPDGDVQFELGDDDVATLTSGSSFFRMIGMASEEFPTIPDVPSEHTYTLDQGVFREMLKKTAYAASTDETRYVINGVLLNFGEDRLTMVATDGRRLALVENEIELTPDSDTDIILPSKTVSELIHILKDEGELKISVKNNQVLFEFSDIKVSSKLIDGVYPNYRQVIPSSCDERITIEREQLLNALRRVGLIATDKSAPMKFTFGNNELELSVQTPDVGEARESIAIKYDGKVIPIAFNSDFLMDPLKNLSNDEVYFELTDELSPGVIKADIPFLYVLMPMRMD